MGFISNIRIGRRLGLGFAVILAMTLLIAMAGISRMNDVAASTRDMMAAPLTKERLITDWYSLNFASIRRTAAIVKSTDPALAPYFKEDAAASMQDQAARLAQVVGVFKLDVQAAAPAAAAAPKAAPTLALPAKPAKPAAKAAKPAPAAVRKPARVEADEWETF